MSICIVQTSETSGGEPPRPISYAIEVHGKKGYVTVGGTWMGKRVAMRAFKQAIRLELRGT